MSSYLMVSCSKVIALHNIQTHISSPLTTFSAHKGAINCVVFNHTNKLIASAGVDGRILLVSMERPENLVMEFIFDNRKTISVLSCSFSATSRFLAAAGADSLVKFWDLKDPKQPPIEIRSHFGSVTTLAWSKDEIVASGSNIGDVFLHSSKNGNVIESFASKNQEGISMIKFSQGDNYNRLGACTASGSVIIWDLNTKSMICYFANVHKSAATAIAFSTFTPVLLISTSLDQNIHFYDIQQKKLFKTIGAQQALNSVALHSDGHTLVVGGMYGGIFIYDLRFPQKAIKLLGHQSTVRYIDFVKEKDSQSKVNNFVEKPSSQSSQSSTASINNPIRPAQQFIAPSATTQVATRQQVANRSSSRVVEQPQVPPPQVPVSRVVEPPRVPAPTRMPPQQAPSEPLRVRSEQKISESSLAGMKEMMTEFEKKIRNEMAQKFQLMHLQMIRQFQIQQREMQSMLENLIVQDRAKDDLIRKLEQENEKLRTNSY